MSQSYLKETPLPSESEYATISSIIARIGDKWSVQTIVMLDKEKNVFQN